MPLTIKIDSLSLSDSSKDGPSQTPTGWEATFHAKLEVIGTPPQALNYPDPEVKDDPRLEEQYRTFLAHHGLPSRLVSTKLYAERPGEMQVIQDGVAALTDALDALVTTWQGREIAISGLPDEVTP